MSREYIGPNGAERPGEHWNARLIREEAERPVAPRTVDLERLADQAWAEADPTGNVRKIRAAKWLREQAGLSLVDAARLVQGAIERAKLSIGDPLDLAQFDEWMTQCGSCDVGLPMACTCPTGDPRWRISALVEEVRRLRRYVDEQDAELSTLREDLEFQTSAAFANQAEANRLRAKLDQPCGSCHPCVNYSDETWRAAGRKPPHVSEWEETKAELTKLRAFAWWVVQLDTPGNVERRSVTLNRIIVKATEAIDGEPS